MYQNPSLLPGVPKGWAVVLGEAHRHRRILTLSGEESSGGDVTRNTQMWVRQHSLPSAGKAEPRVW